MKDFLLDYTQNLLGVILIALVLLGPPLLVVGVVYLFMVNIFLGILAILLVIPLVITIVEKAV